MTSQVKTKDPTWIYPEKNPHLLHVITSELFIHPVVAQILVSRGFKNVEEIHEYLYAKLPNLLEPELFPDIEDRNEITVKIDQSRKKR